MHTRSSLSRYLTTANGTLNYTSLRSKMKFLLLLSAALRTLAASCPCQPASKRGILYTDARFANSFRQQCAGCSWASNWASVSNGLLSSEPSFQYIPTLRDTNSSHTSTWEADVRDALAGGSQALFSFNEPDIRNSTAGSNLSVPAAVGNHTQYMRQFVGQALIGSPAVSSTREPGVGLQWLSSFIDQCSKVPGCHFDFCSVHWYGNLDQIEMLFQHLDSAHAICGEKPLWLSEVALLMDDQHNPSDLDKCEFISSVWSRLESLSYLATYAFFMGRWAGEPVLPSTSSSFGRAYASMETFEQCT